MKTYFDVGANDGSWGIQKATDEPDCVVYAFEPTPRLINVIRECSVGLPNYFLIEKAASNKNGLAKFNLADGGGGCSSLLEIKPRQVLVSTWPGRDDIVKIGEVEVECIRMDTFCTELGINKIDFFHCDTQGHDLDVLESFGELLGIIEEGEIETAGSTDRAIYVDQNNTIETCTNFFASKNITIVSIDANDPLKNEFNIIFKKSEV